MAQAGDEGGGLPVSHGPARAQPLAAPAANVATRHVGGRPCLVDEDQAFGIEVELAIEPLFPTLQDVGPVLLGGVRCLLARDPMPVEEPPRRPDPNRRAALGEQHLQLGERMSSFASIASRMKVACASIRAARRSPPCGLAAGVLY